MATDGEASSPFNEIGTEEFDRNGEMKEAELNDDEDFGENSCKVEGGTEEEERERGEDKMERTENNEASKSIESQEPDPEPRVKITEDEKSTLFFSNLPNDVRTSDYLKHILDGVGKAQGCLVVGGADATKKVHRSAFAAFASENEAKRVLETLNSIGVREVFANFGKKRVSSDAEAKADYVPKKNNKKLHDEVFIPRYSSGQPNKCIFVRNINREATEEEIRTAFASFGEIEKITFPKQKKGITFRGICFITYGSIIEAKNAVEQMNLRDFQGRQLNVRFFAERKEFTCEDNSDGKTLILQNVPASATEAVIHEAFRPFGDIGYIIKLVDPYTEKMTGSAHVRFRKKEDADVCLMQSEVTKGIDVENRKVTVAADIWETETEEVDEKDDRNLHLAKEGKIRPGTEAAVGVSASDMGKRLVLEVWKRRVMKSENMCVSDKRLCVRNIPAVMKDKTINKMMREAAGPNAVITECTIMRDETKAAGDENPKVFAFVSFSKHENALAALRTLNNNRKYFTNNQRPIVEFSLESRVVKNKKDDFKKNENGTERGVYNVNTVAGNSVGLTAAQKRLRNRKRKNEGGGLTASDPALKLAKIQPQPTKKQFPTGRGRGGFRGRGRGGYQGNRPVGSWLATHEEEQNNQASRFIAQLRNIVGAADVLGLTSQRTSSMFSGRFTDLDPPSVRRGNYHEFW